MTEKDKDKIRVYELAKELKLDSKRLIDLLHRLHVENIKNHMSTVEPQAVQVVRDIMDGKLPPEPPAAVKPPAPKPAAPTAPTAPTAPVAAAPPSLAQRPEPVPEEVAGEARPAAAGPGPAPRGTVLSSSNPNREMPRRTPPTSNPSRPPASGGYNRPPARTGSPDRPTRPPGSGYGSRDARPGAPRPYDNGARSGYGNRPPAGGAPRPGAPRPGAPRPGGGDRPARPPGTGPRPTSGTGGPPRGPRTGGGFGAARPQVPQAPAAPGRTGKDAPRRGHGPDRRGGQRPTGANDRRRHGFTDDERVRKTRKQRHQNRDSSPMPPVQRRLVISGPILVKDLADQLGVKVTDLIKRLIGLGVMATMNQELDREIAVIVAQELGAEVEERNTAEEVLENLLQGETDRPEDLEARPPVVTVMGHVDHGKTSLLDRIRTTRVTASEAGGITQHIGASVVSWNDQPIVFLDTPGHEAFTAMRARGAQVTDIAVLVVAADDGVMPQTVEAINHAKAAGVPIVVAVNKVDLPNANPDRVKNELGERGVLPEEWGGDTMMIPVSARTGQGINELLEAILLQAEVLELKANPNRPARGTVIEAKLDRGRGPVATILVKQGTLSVGDIFVSGAVSGKVRALIDDRGARVKKAGPSMPVEVLGFNEPPEGGDDFAALSDERQVRAIAEARKQVSRQKTAVGTLKGVTLDEFYQRLKDEEVRDLNLVLKADVQGSVEAVAEALGKLTNEEVRVRLLHSGVGSITESDVMLAEASGAIIIGFGVSVEPKARGLAEHSQVDIRQYRVIYDIIEDVSKAMTGMLAPRYQEVVLGRAEVREVFRVPRVGAVAGCYVVDGKILRSGKVRVIRNGSVIFEGGIASLKRFKDDVREVQTGFECGLGIERFNDVKIGDQLEVFTEEEVKAS